jgi:hypothetical protein
MKNVPRLRVDVALVLGGALWVMIAKKGTRALDLALQLDSDTVVPGHGTLTTRQEMRKFRDSTLALRTRAHEMVVQKKTGDEIARMLQSDFHWIQVLLDRGLDGLIGELQ